MQARALFPEHPIGVEAGVPPSPRPQGRGDEGFILSSVSQSFVNKQHAGRAQFVCVNATALDVPRQPRTGRSIGREVGGGAHVGVLIQNGTKDYH